MSASPAPEGARNRRKRTVSPAPAGQNGLDKDAGSPDGSVDAGNVLRRDVAPRHPAYTSALAFVVAILILGPTFYLWWHMPYDNIRYELSWAVLLGAGAMGLTLVAVPHAAFYTARAGLRGKDLGAKGTRREDKFVPESLGVVSGITFLVCIIVGQLIFARKPDALATYNAALLSVCFMVLLGFADDVLDLRWRYKLLLPTVASLPLLCSYPGITHIIIPKPLRFLFAAVDGSTWWGRAVEALIIVDGNSDGAVVDLGMFYYLYMALLAVFATNSINILAGINGVEVGQTVIIACAVLFTNVLELTRSGGDITNPHLFSAALLLPFIGTSLGLIRYNWYPAQVFVGDTFCYFAGMTLAVSGILGHFSKTLLLFLAPQVFNFLYSVPQILKIVPCPRHRLPAVDPKTGLRYPSTYVAKDGSTRPNMTLINLVLRIFGPMREEQLTRTVLGIQAACCTVAIVVRYQLATLIYDDA